MGKTGAGTDEYFGVQDEIDVYFWNICQKSMAGIGAFVASRKDVVNSLTFKMRSQIFAKSLPMPMVIGAMKRLELLRDQPEHKKKLWDVVNALQKGLKENNMNIGNTESPVTPVFLSGGVSEATQITYDLRENLSCFLFNCCISCYS